MFACLPAGRPVSTDFRQLENNKFLFTLNDARDLNHIAIFLCQPSPQLVNGLCASIYFSLPPYSQWSLLGFITNEKPSAFFRISGLKNSSSASISSHHGTSTIEMEMGMGTEDNSPLVAQIGISIEPLVIVQTQLEQLKQNIALTTSQNFSMQPNITIAPAPVSSEFVEFANKMLTNFFHYVTSFSQTQNVSVQTIAASPTIPTNVFEKWYQNFVRKFNANPQFWKEF